jgi:hypothetical protein
MYILYIILHHILFFIFLQTKLFAKKNEYYQNIIIGDIL